MRPLASLPVERVGMVPRREGEEAVVVVGCGRVIAARVRVGVVECPREAWPRRIITRERDWEEVVVIRRPTRVEYQGRVSAIAALKPRINKNYAGCDKDIFLHMVLQRVGMEEDVADLRRYRPRRRLVLVAPPGTAVEILFHSSSSHYFPLHEVISSRHKAIPLMSWATWMI